MTVRARSLAPSKSRQDLPIRARASGSIGLLLGVAAATVGVESPISAIPVRPWYVFVLLAGVVAFGAALEGRGGALLRSKIRVLDLAFLAYIVIAVFVEIVNGTELGYSADIASIFEPICWMVAYFAARIASYDASAGVRLLKAFSMPVFILAPLGVAQIMNLGGINELTTRFVSSTGFSARLDDDRLLRAIGLIGHWTGFGAYLAVIFTAGVALLIASRRLGIDSQRYSLAVLLFAAVGLATTLTFSPILIALGVLVACARRAGFNLRLVVGLAVVVGLVGVFFGDLVQERVDQQLTYGVGQVEWVPTWVPSTLRYRIGIWATQTIPMIGDRPLTGWGNGVYSSATGVGTSGRKYPSQLDWLSPESQWFATAMNGGLLLLAALLVLLLSALVLAGRARRSATAGWLASPLFFMIIFTAIFAATAPMFTNRGLPLGMWVLVGVVAGLAGTVGDHRDVDPPTNSLVSPK